MGHCRSHTWPISAGVSSIRACALAVILCVVPSPSQALVRIFYPANTTYTTERTIPVMGFVKEELWLAQRGYAVVKVNGGKSYEFPLKEGYFFLGEVYLEDGLNNIMVEDQELRVFAGDGTQPEPGFTRRYGHTTRDDSCDQCHKADKDDQGNFVLGLLENAETLCRWCHLQAGSYRKQAAKETVHPPVRDGQCLTCHLPHTGDRPALLRDDPKKLCQTCHPKIFEDLKTKPFVHGPLNVSGCDLCHRAHGSSEPYLLNAAEKDLCRQCHGKLVPDPAKAPEGNRHPGIAEGRCHECHSAHATNNPKMMKKIVNNLCVECHPEKSHNFHEEKGFSIYICGRCHDIHQPDAAHLIINESRDLCDQCHKEKRRGEFIHQPVSERTCFECHGFHEKAMEKDQRVVCFRCHERDEAYRDKHPIETTEGGRCTECHAPHSSTVRSLTYPNQHEPFAKRQCDSCHSLLPADAEARKAYLAQSTLCFQCHPEKKIPAEIPEGLSIHKPFAKEGCRSCHLTHNSEFPYLLPTDTLELCGQCHSFVRQLRNFLPASLHSSVKAGRCGDCHDTHFGRREKLLKKDSRDLCLGCHQKLLSLPSGELYQYLHKPSKEGNCRRCHSGHFAKFPALLKDNQANLCQKCHQSLVKSLSSASSNSVHAPAKKGECGSCHGVHGSTNRNMLKKEGNALCKTCHQNLRKGQHHSYQEDFLTYQEGPLRDTKVSCLQCHRSHTSTGQFLLLGIDSPVCRECHTF